jgi:hypothetical protein
VTSLDAQLLDRLLTEPADVAWPLIFKELWKRLSLPIKGDSASELVQRDKSIEGLDLVLSSSAWDLWRDFESAAPSNAKQLESFWNQAPAGKAVLVLDALSLREAPWLVQGATQRGYSVKKASALASALPSDTTSFAKLLGLPQRSALASGAVGSLKLSGATTALFDQPWTECADTVPNSSSLFVWHEWPDSLLHDYAAPGKGLSPLAQAVGRTLQSEDFWTFIDRLATGRSLVITSDHGYAASGQFGDVHDVSQKEYLASKYGAERFIASTDQADSAWTPPLDISLMTARGLYRFVLGRRSWSVAGGRKNLAHGGISLLEVASPYIELVK